jgi:hypothetical protein
MSKTDPYFQFPVAMLRPEPHTPQQIGPLIQDIVDYSLWHYGLSLHENARDQIPILAEEFAEMHGVTHDKDNYHQLILLAAAHRLNVTLPSVTKALAAAKAKHSQYGTRGTQCRLRANIAWDAHNHHWPLLKFKVLCGVIAGIGDSPAIRLNNRMIQAIGAGYNSPKGVNNCDLLPQSSARYWIDQLWYSNFFQFCKKGHERWYSIRHASDAELVEAVRKKPVKQKTKKVLDANDVEF